MTSIKTSQGSCLCGAVHLTVKAMSQNVGACHCNMCRKWSGGPFLAVDCGDGVIFEGNENISVFSSSDWAERGFCHNCGTHLFYRLKQNQQHFIPIGLLEESDSLVFDHQVFIDEKPPFYGFENKTHNMTGQELFDQFMKAENQEASDH